MSPQRDGRSGFRSQSCVVFGAAVTNYCKNLLTIEGSRQQVEVFARKCLSLRDGSYELDFEKILPIPAILKGLRENAQDSLELSRKRLAALEAADYRSEEDWVLHNWGFTPDRMSIKHGI
jgi:hypothetical protein